MQPLKGFNKDGSPLTQQEQAAARNVVISISKQAVINEDGTALFCTNYPADLTPVGIIPFHEEKIVCSVPSEVGLVTKDGRYTRVVKADFGFDVTAPVTGLVEFNSRGEAIVVLLDRLNIPRALNITRLPFRVDANKVIVNAAQVGIISLFPEASVPIVDSMTLEEGGSLKTGANYYTFAYEDKEGFVGGWLNMTLPINVYQSRDVVPGELTTKSVRLRLSNIDNNYRYLHVAVIEKVKGVNTARSFAKLSVSGPTLEVLHSGSESSNVVPLEEVLVDRVSYKNFQTATNLDGRLHLANGIKRAKLNYQKYANNIKVKPLVDFQNLITEDGMTFIRPIEIGKQFLHGEVYSFQIAFLFKDGTYSEAFHIPGRKPMRIAETWNTANLLDNVPLTSVINYAPHIRQGLYIGNNLKYFHTESNPGIIVGGKPAAMDYWENEDEVYPETDQGDFEVWNATGKIGDFTGQKVRHHKMPALGRTDGGPLGIALEDIYIPDEIKDQVEAIEIFYAQRDYNNATIIGQSLLFHGAKYKHRYDGLINSIVNAPGNIYGRQVLDNVRGDAYTISELILEPSYFRFYSFDMFVDRPAVTPTHIINEKKIVQNMNSAGEGHYEGAFLHTNTVKRTEKVLPENRIRKVQNVKYMDYDSNDGTLHDNRFSEEAYVGQILDGITRNPSTSFLGINRTKVVYGEDMNIHIDLHEHEANLTNLCVHRKNVYVNFNQQNLVSTGVVVKVTGNTLTVPRVFGGDISKYQYGQRHTAKNDETHEHVYNVVRNVISWSAQSINNPEMRYIDKANAFDTEFFPGASLAYNGEQGIVSYMYKPWNTRFVEMYSKDHTSIGNLNRVFPDDYYYVNTLIADNLIIRSPVNNTEARVLSWKQFLPNDYYYAPKNRGPIYNIEAFSGELLIHHEYGLFSTIGKDVLNTSKIEVVLGIGDLFAKAPREVIPTPDGYTGTRQPASCFVCKYGYVFVGNEGKVFIYTFNRQLIELTEIVNRKYLKDKLEIKLQEQLGDSLPFHLYNNPLNYSGISAGFDKDNDRIIISKRDRVLKDLTKFKGKFINDATFLARLKVGDIVINNDALVEIESITTVGCDVTLTNASVSAIGVLTYTLAGTKGPFTVKLEKEDGTVIFTKTHTVPGTYTKHSIANGKYNLIVTDSIACTTSVVLNINHPILAKGTVVLSYCENKDVWPNTLVKVVAFGDGTYRMELIDYSEECGFANKTARVTVSYDGPNRFGPPEWDGTNLIVSMTKSVATPQDEWFKFQFFYEVLGSDGFYKTKDILDTITIPAGQKFVNDVFINVGERIKGVNEFTTRYIDSSDPAYYGYVNIGL